MIGRENVAVDDLLVASLKQGVGCLRSVPREKGNALQSKRYVPDLLLRSDNNSNTCSCIQITT